MSRAHERLGARDEAMREDRHEQPLDVLGVANPRPSTRATARATRSSARLPRTEAPTSSSSARASCGRARRSSGGEADRRRRARRPRRAPRPPSPRDDRPEPLEWVAVHLVLDDPHLLVEAGVSERGADEEAVELGLRSGKVPSCSIGFSVAITKNGAGSGRVTPSTVTCPSAIASSSADCAFGSARLISSTSTMFANTGPGRNSNRRAAGPRPRGR